MPARLTLLAKNKRRVILSASSSRWLMSYTSISECGSLLPLCSSDLGGGTANQSGSKLPQSKVHSLVIVSSRFRIMLATVVHAASSLLSSLGLDLDSPTRTSFAESSA